MSENATVTIHDIMRENTAVSSFNYNYIPKRHQKITAKLEPLHYLNVLSLSYLQKCHNENILFTKASSLNDLPL